MTVTVTTALRAAGVRPRRLWLVLVLLVGLVGMHGLASDHGGTAAAAAMPASSAAALDLGVTGMTTAGPAAPAAPAAAVAGVRVAPRPAGPGMVMAGLCLAVLTGALLLVAAQRLLPAGARPDDRLPSGLLARARALPSPPPPDLVAGLCVSRT